MQHVWTMPVQPVAFLLLWEKAQYVEDLAWWLGRPAAEVQAAAAYLRLPEKPLNHGQALAEMFVRAWEDALTPEGVALELGWTVQRVLRFARKLGRSGVRLKTLPHHPGYWAVKPN